MAVARVWRILRPKTCVFLETFIADGRISREIRGVGWPNVRQTRATRNFPSEFWQNKVPPNISALPHRSIPWHCKSQQILSKRAYPIESLEHLSRLP